MAGAVKCADLANCHSADLILQPEFCIPGSAKTGPATQNIWSKVFPFIY